jgi:tetratricopeptide (TPR) repeat protein
MNRFIKLLTVPLIVATFITVAAADGETARGLEVGDVLETRSLATLSAGDISIPADTGVTAVVFWANWSPRSAPALRMWQEFANKYADRNVSIVTVNSEKQVYEDEDRYQVEAFLSDNMVTLPTHLDEQLKLFNEVGVIVIPTTIFLGTDGSITYKYAGFPTSAREDIQADLEDRLGIVSVKVKEDPNRGKLAYQPKNNALLYYNLGRRLEDKGFLGKARPKYIEALQKDPDYADPLRALEGIYFADGRTALAEEALRVYLTENGLESQIANIGPPVVPGDAEGEPADSASAPAVAASPDEAPAGSVPAADKPLSPMEKMKLMMEKKQGE